MIRSSAVTASPRCMTFRVTRLTQRNEVGRVHAARRVGTQAFEEQPSLSERMKAIMSGWEVRARRMGTA
jgi:hypothetical protein